MTEEKKKAVGQAPAAEPEKPLLRKIAIVIEEVNDKGHFRLRMEGDCDRIGKLPDEKLSIAEFVAGQVWAQGAKIMKGMGLLGQAKPPLHEAPPPPPLVVP